MAAKLPEHLVSEIDAHPGEPIRVVDQSGDRTFYIVSEDRLTSLEAAAHQESEATMERLRAMIAEGDESPSVPAEVAEVQIMKMAQEADARHA